MNEAEKREITRKFSAAMAARDIDLLKAVMTSDVIWSVPGNSLMSGEAQGVEAILKRAEIMHRHEVNVQIEHVIFGLKDVAQHLHNTGRYGGRILDEHISNVYGLRENRICRIDTFVSDVGMLNAFFV
jgi:ketosteroid isomerase-like protein